MPDEYSETLHHVASDTIDHVAAITDPGERDRASHLWGDRLMINFGNFMAWLFPILMLAIVAQVLMRKAGFNQAWLDDAQWWIYGAALTTGFGYAITTESHVRVDIFHANFSPRKKARIELYALGWCLLPFLILMVDNLIHYSYSSFVAREGSDSPNGLHGLFLLKMLLPLLFVMAIIATLATLQRHLATLINSASKPALWTVILAAFPAMWFAAERVIYYVLWWVVRLSSPDIVPRRIGKEPLLEPTMWYGLALVLALAAVSFALTRRTASKA